MAMGIGKSISLYKLALSHRQLEKETVGACILSEVFSKLYFLLNVSFAFSYNFEAQKYQNKIYIYQNFKLVISLETLN